MGVRRGAPGVAGLACVALAVLRSPAAFAQRPEGFIPGTIHTIFSTECNKYFDWQSLGLVHSARHVGQEGPITRLMACNDPHYETNVDVDTHTHPNWAVHPVTGDRYSPYNKPASIVHWLEHGQTTAEYIVILDADMVLRRPMNASLLEVERGRPVSAHYGYLVGIFPDHYMKVKEKVRNVEKAQQVGGFSVMHVSDLRRVAPLWLKWTEEVRSDPESWGNTGDIFNANGKAGPPWIAEMYGYVFACAEVGLNFKVSDKFMLYPGYVPPASEPWPVVLHYGITYSMGEYAFDKHWYMSTDMTSCPSQLFQRPPELASLGLEAGSVEERRADVALTVGWGLYNATRAHAVSVCGLTNPEDPPKIRYRCSTSSNNVVSCVQKQPGELDPPPPPRASAALRGGAAGVGTACVDAAESCCGWALSGECVKNPSFMTDSCPLACSLCGAYKGAKVAAACAPPPRARGRAVKPPPPTTLRAPVAISDAAPSKSAPRDRAASLEADGEHIDPALKPQQATPDRLIVPHVTGQAEAEAPVAEQQSAPDAVALAAPRAPRAPRAPSAPRVLRHAAEWARESSAGAADSERMGALVLLAWAAAAGGTAACLRGACARRRRGARGLAPLDGGRALERKGV